MKWKVMKVIRVINRMLSIWMFLKLLFMNMEVSRLFVVILVSGLS